jgi:hypothetical protein
VTSTPPGSFCHVEAVLPYGRAFSSREPRGVDFIDSGTLVLADKLRWVMLDSPYVLTAASLEWLEQERGAPYDFIGAGLSAIGETPLPRGKARFCSDIVEELLVRCGMNPMKYVPPPNQLYDHLCSQLGIVRAPSGPMPPQAATDDARERLMMLAKERAGV